MTRRVVCPHCNTAFTPDVGAQLDDCSTCGRSVQVKTAPLTEDNDVVEALADISAAGMKGIAVGLRLHIKGLTRRLAEAEECLTIAHMDGYHKGQKAAEARVRELEAFKARVLEWARGNCGTCEHKNVRREDTPCEQCLHTSNFDNWAPPSGWEDIA